MRTSACMASGAHATTWPPDDGERRALTLTAPLLLEHPKFPPGKNHAGGRNICPALSAGVALAGRAATVGRSVSRAGLAFARSWTLPACAAGGRGRRGRTAARGVPGGNRGTRCAQCEPGDHDADRCAQHSKRNQLGTHQPPAERANVSDRRRGSRARRWLCRWAGGTCPDRREQRTGVACGARCGRPTGDERQQSGLKTHYFQFRDHRGWCA